MQGKKFGIAAMVDAAVWLDSVAGLEILGIGRAAFERADCTLEAAGRRLLMKVSLQGGWIWLSAGSLDEDEPPQPICNLPDTPEGWAHARKFLRALENSGVTSLKQRPIQIGEGPGGYAIEW
jgi:hypothetical protein